MIESDIIALLENLLGQALVSIREAPHDDHRTIVVLEFEDGALMAFMADRFWVQTPEDRWYECSAPPAAVH